MLALSQTCQEDMKDERIVKIYALTQANPCFAILYKRYARKVFAKCISMLKDEAKAGDATQDIFMKIFMNLSKFNHESRFGLGRTVGSTEEGSSRSHQVQGRQR